MRPDTRYQKVERWGGFRVTYEGDLDRLNDHYAYSARGLDPRTGKTVHTGFVYSIRGALKYANQYAREGIEQVEIIGYPQGSI